jgi:O-antigen ligase
VVQQSGGVALARIVNPLTSGKTPKDAYEATKVTRGVTLTQAAGPLGVLFAAVPILICGFALDATRRPNRRRAFTVAAFALGIYVVFFSFIGIFFFFSMAGLFFAAYQARKADPPPRRPVRARPAAEE